MKKEKFDIVVIGGGHAGVEAALCCSRKKLSTLLITQKIERIAYMSCNPSIGGIAKGHMVRELDVLGGEMAKAADETCIQFKRLNTRKGPAVRASRTLNDKRLYSLYMQNSVKKEPFLKTIEGEVKKIIIKNYTAKGVVLNNNEEIFCFNIIVTAGTFLNAIMYIGDKTFVGGRRGDEASYGLSDSLKEEGGFKVERLKTGTPPRLKASSINWKKTTPQEGDESFFPFSFSSPSQYKQKQIKCFLSRTNYQTHEIILNNIDKSPLYAGKITGIGPRYCPSIEDKVIKFPDKDSHHTFLEPEGLESDYIYLSGISSSLPEEVQYSFLKTIPGLENVQIYHFGYAVEYDFFDPIQVKDSLETKNIKNLFFAGQINGTSGYEEAAVQGFMAGINASNKVFNQEEFILKRNEAYIGVLIDDLITKGTKEPYRMFTSRAEHRLLLREDNVSERLAEKGFKKGVLSNDLYDKIQKTIDLKNKCYNCLKQKKIYPNKETNEKLKKLNTAQIVKPITLEELMRRPESSRETLGFFINKTDVFSNFEEKSFDCRQKELIYDFIEIQIKYDGYIKREEEFIKKMKKYEYLKIPEDIDYFLLKGLSLEEKEKLNNIKPKNIAQAQRISGVKPSAIQALLVFLTSLKKRSSH